MTDATQHKNSISKRLRRTVITKLAFTLTALIIGCMATPRTVHAQCTRCCFSYANVTVNPTTAEEGQPVVVSTGVFNCRPFAQVITARGKRHAQSHVCVVCRGVLHHCVRATIPTPHPDVHVCSSELCRQVHSDRIR
jgi:hypothetical protein